MNPGTQVVLGNRIRGADRAYGASEWHDKKTSSDAFSAIPQRIAHDSADSPGDPLTLLILQGAGIETNLKSFASAVEESQMGMVGVPLERLEVVAVVSKLGCFYMRRR